MITRVEIRNWQSLRAVDLTLGRVTVIVGASNCGKSALIRALRALASNMRGAAQITRGQKQTAVTVRTSSGHIISLERSETAGRYRLVTPDGREATYTKLAGGVPEQITAALRIDPAPAGGGSVNFAGQLDRPYLLDESGAQVARELGELTNVTVIFEAVREANRRRNAHAATLRTRETDLAEAKTRLADYRRLPDQLALLRSAEELHAHATTLARRLTHLRQLTAALGDAETVTARSTPPAVPDDGALLEAADRVHRLRELLRHLSHAVSAASAAAVPAAARQEAEAEADLAELLSSIERCPTCGQIIPCEAVTVG